MKTMKLALALALGLTSAQAHASHEGKKVEDVVTAVVWIGHETAEAAVAAAGFTRDEIAKPIAEDAKELAQLTAQGAIGISLAVKDGVVAVSNIVVKGATHVYTDALNPFYTQVIRDAVYTAGLKNGAYRMFLKPVGQGAAAGAYWGAEAADSVYRNAGIVPASIVAIPLVAGGAVSGAAVVTYQIVVKNLVYDKALKPAGQAIGKGGKAAGQGIWKAMKWYGGTFKN
ncbi:MAG: hypothetical protein K2X47_12540 [Bdellovibrionales bacterium]|nr:hypothetical protein [Bdellovibrionales bacterium]